MPPVSEACVMGFYSATDTLILLSSRQSHCWLTWTNLKNGS